MKKVHAFTYLRFFKFQDISAFSSLRYFGVQREAINGHVENDESRLFSKLRDFIREELDDRSVRSPRSMELIFKTFKVCFFKA